MLLQIECFINDKKGLMSISMRKIEDKIVFKSGKNFIFSIFQEDFRDNFFICKNFLYQIILCKINRDGMTMERLLQQNFFYLHSPVICEYNERFL